MHRVASVVHSVLKAIDWRWLVSTAWLSGCMVGEGSQACGKHQSHVVTDDMRYCKCEPGWIIDDDLVGCKPCAENETSDGRVCACKQGYARAMEGAPCAMSSVGGACSSDTACSGAAAVCVTDGAEGYCSSKGCQTSRDCQPHWVCDQVAGESVCKKPPDGFGRACQGPEDCAGSAATFCDSFQTHTCLVQGCGKGMPCLGDWACCEISILATALCIEPGALVDGACPAGTLVTP